SRRPARPPTTASAMPPRSSRSANRTSSSPAVARSSTGPCRRCSTPWARFRRNTTTRPPRPRAPSTSAATASGAPAGPAVWGVLVLEELEHARARGARIYAEVGGYGATSDGYDMVAPSGEGAARCMRMALSTVKAPVDYVNPHATATPIGDLKEIEALREVFGAKCPPISATKSLTGHSLGAAGVQEAIYSLLMMNNGFICESANIETIDPAFEDMPIMRERRDNVALSCVLSNSFGFGGTNASIVLKRLDA